jgi:hypothetical protein
MEGKIKAVVRGLGEDQGKRRMKKVIASCAEWETATANDLSRQTDHPYQYVKESQMWGVTEPAGPIGPDLI